MSASSKSNADHSLAKPAKGTRDQISKKPSALELLPLELLAAELAWTAPSQIARCRKSSKCLKGRIDTLLEDKTFLRELAQNLSPKKDLIPTEVLNKSLQCAIAEADTLKALGALEKGADPSADSSNVMFGTLLAEAAATGQSAVCLALIKFGASPSYCQRRGARVISPLGWASMSGNLASVKVLLQAGAKPEFLRPNGLLSPLGYAIQGGHAPVVKLLVENGAELSESNRWGHPVLELIPPEFRDKSEMALYLKKL